LLIVALALLALPSTGQGQSAWLSGRAIDAATGEAVVGAEVRAAGASAVTGEDGAWRLGPLSAGAHELRAIHLGYADWQAEVQVGGAAASALTLRLTPRPVSLDALVVTAGRRLQRLADAPVATELVGRREIAETGATDLASVLTERTGVELEGGHPAGSGVMIQGMGSERVLVLMDGQPFIGRISGSVDVSRIPTAMIERIEVVKGPQSTLYGSEAMGGVVNVITRDAVGGPAWSASATATAGGQGRMDLSGGLIGGTGPLDGLVEAGRRTIELTPGQPGESGALATRWDGLAKLGWRPAAGVRVEAGGLLLDERQRWRAGQLYNFADNTQWGGRLGAVLERGAHRFSPTLYATSFDHLSRRATTDEPVAGTGERETQRLMEAELLYNLAVGDHGFDVGAEARREAIRSDRVAGGERTDETYEAFGQATLVWRGFSLVPGVRASWSEPWGAHWTPRVAALYRPLPEVALRVSAGEGFRAPSFKELYMDFLNSGPGFGYTVRGNPDLRPEVSRNLTASVEWTGARTYLRVQGFENRFDDFIETRVVGDSSGVQVYTYGNVDDGFTRGAEGEAGATWGGWRFEGGYGLLRAERAQTGEPLLGRPRSSARATIGYARPSGLRVSLTGVRTGRTPMSRSEEGVTSWREAYLRFDARVAHELPGGLELVAGVDNLLDEQSPEWPGFAGRHIYTGLSWRMSGSGSALDTE